MSDSLPERPDLDQLRRRAKELRDAARRGDAAALERFARHHPLGETGRGQPGRRPAGHRPRAGLCELAQAQGRHRRRRGLPPGSMSAFVAASVEGRLRQASDIFRADPGIAGRSLLAATVLGDAEAVREMLAADPAAAVAIDDERGWPPLLYACYSRWHQIDPGRAAGLAEVVRVLLDAGASPNTNDGGRPRYRSALKGSVEVNNPEHHRRCCSTPGPTPTRVSPSPRPSVIATTAACGCCSPTVPGWPEPGPSAPPSTTTIPVRCHCCSTPSKRRRRGGATRRPRRCRTPRPTPPCPSSPPSSTPEPTREPTDEDGVSALRLAVRAGRNDTAARLRAAGATDDGTDVDRFIGACLNGDRPAAEQLLADHPDLPDRLTDQDRAVIVDAAASRPAETIALMLDLGFSPHARNDFGEQPLHTAAYSGNAAVVRLLLDAGADVDARDARFDGTPLAFATVGSGEQAGKPGDWIETVRLLIEAGASRHDVWVAGKPPSEEVADLLQRYGITPDEPAEPPARRPGRRRRPARSPAPASWPTSPGTSKPPTATSTSTCSGRSCTPQVHWTGLCTNSAQVLDWYRGLLADGTVADRPQRGSRPRRRRARARRRRARAEGARPAPPQQLYQVFTVDGRADRRHPRLPRPPQRTHPRR